MRHRCTGGRYRFAAKSQLFHLSVELGEAFFFIVVCTVDLHHTLAAVSLANHISQIGQGLLKTSRIASSTFSDPTDNEGQKWSNNEGHK